MLRAAVTVNGNESVIVTGNTPAQLGTEIGKVIEKDSRTDTDLMYHVTGPSSRRIASDDQS